jgi:hypothetical protein
LAVEIRKNRLQYRYALPKRNEGLLHLESARQIAGCPLWGKGRTDFAKVIIEYHKY